MLLMLYRFSGVIWLARLAEDEKVGGSNPPGSIWGSSLVGENTCPANMRRGFDSLLLHFCFWYYIMEGLIMWWDQRPAKSSYWDKLSTKGSTPLPSFRVPKKKEVIPLWWKGYHATLRTLCFGFESWRGYYWKWSEWPRRSSRKRLCVKLRLRVRFPSFPSVL